MIVKMESTDGATPAGSLRSYYEELFRRGRNGNPLRVGELNVALLRGDFDAPELFLLFLAGRSREGQPVLVPKHHIQLIEKWPEGNGSLKTLEESFSARRVRYVREIALAEVDAKHVARDAPNPAGVERVNHDPGPLGPFDRGINVGTGWEVAAKAVNAVGDEQDFAARSGGRPALYQIH